MGDKATAGRAAGRHGGAKSRRRAAQLLEAVAENDEDLLTKYLEGEELSGDEIRKGLALGHRRGRPGARVRGLGDRRASAWRASWTRSLSFFPSPAADHA